MRIHSYHGWPPVGGRNQGMGGKWRHLLATLALADHARMHKTYEVSLWLHGAPSSAEQRWTRWVAGCRRTSTEGIPSYRRRTAIVTRILASCVEPSRVLGRTCSCSGAGTPPTTSPWMDASGPAPGRNLCIGSQTFTGRVVFPGGVRFRRLPRDPHSVASVFVFVFSEPVSRNCAWDSCSCRQFDNALHSAARRAQRKRAFDDIRSDDRDDAIDVARGGVGNILGDDSLDDALAMLALMDAAMTPAGSSSTRVLRIRRDSPTCFDDPHNPSSAGETA